MELWAYSTIAFVYISYAGVTKIAAIAGEVKNPSKNIPISNDFSLLSYLYYLCYFPIL